MEVELTGVETLIGAARAASTASASASSIRAAESHSTSNTLPSTLGRSSDNKLGMKKLAIGLPFREANSEQGRRRRGECASRGSYAHTIFIPSSRKGYGRV